MPTVNTTDPQHPHADWTSGGRAFHVSADCDCPEGSGQVACQRDCAADVQEAADLLAVLHPQDP